jgi:4-hydroxybenzoate polyprenyltransferase
MPPRSPHTAQASDESHPCRTGDAAPATRWGWSAIGDAIAYSSGLATAVGAGLSLVSSRLLEADSASHWATLSAAGTFIIYNLDRLRDVERDRGTSPRRTAFIERNRRPIQGAVAIAAMIFAAACLVATRPIQALCLAIGAIGLFHRRLKEHAALKTLYVSLAWVASCVGIPWLAAGRPPDGPWLAGILWLVLTANLIASDLRDDETQLPSARPRTILAIGLACTMAALALALMAPAPMAAVAWIALVEGLALVGFRAGERYGLLVIDGALLAGSACALLHLHLV